MTFDGRAISAVACRCRCSARWIATLQREGRRARGIARDVIAEIASRLEFLGEVGLGYLTLDRAAPTLGGEAQRIRLAAQLGSNLQGVPCSTSRRSGCTSARQPDPAGGAEVAQRQGQHARRRRTRRGHDPPRRPRHRHRPRRRQARRHARRRGHGGRPGAAPGIADRALSRPAAALIRCSRAARSTGDADAARAGRAPAQPAPARPRRADRQAGRGDRRQWLGQEHARATCCSPTCTPPSRSAQPRPVATGLPPERRRPGWAARPSAASSPSIACSKSTRRRSARRRARVRRPTSASGT